MKSRKKAAPPPRVGRPPAGADGEKVSDYTQLSMRVPGHTKMLIEALSGMTGLPAWRLLGDALALYVEGLPDDERRLLRGIQERRARES
jgi:hypothetical protein